jgi:hypothetical protein
LIDKKQTDNKGGGKTLNLIEDDSLSLKDIGNYLDESEFEQGTLSLKVLRAKIYIDTELFGNMDPYIVVECEN